jgi:hypothetical protein
MCVNITIKFFGKTTLSLFYSERFQFDETHHLLIHADLISWAKTHSDTIRKTKEALLIASIKNDLEVNTTRTIVYVYVSWIECGKISYNIDR